METISSDNWLIFFRAVSRAVKSSSGEEALAMILASRRSFHDISWALFQKREMQIGAYL